MNVLLNLVWAHWKMFHFRLELLLVVTPNKSKQVWTKSEINVFFNLKLGFVEDILLVHWNVECWGMPHVIILRLDYHANRIYKTRRVFVHRIVQSKKHDIGFFISKIIYIHYTYRNLPSLVFEQRKNKLDWVNLLSVFFSKLSITVLYTIYLWSIHH